MDPFEEWIARWNDVADSAAVFASQCRAPLLRDALDIARTDWRKTAQDLRGLRGIYFAIAEATQHENEAPETEILPVGPPLPVLPMGERLSEDVPVGWKIRLREAPVPEFFLHEIGELL